MSKLIHHPIEKEDCKISKFEDWDNDVWDVFVSHHGAFATSGTKELDRYELP